MLGYFSQHCQTGIDKHSMLGTFQNTNGAKPQLIRQHVSTVYPKDLQPHNLYNEAKEGLAISADRVLCIRNEKSDATVESQKMPKIAQSLIIYSKAEAELTKLHGPCLTIK